jgi:hypothetical protein
MVNVSFYLNAYESFTPILGNEEFHALFDCDYKLYCLNCFEQA